MYKDLMEALPDAEEDINEAARVVSEKKNQLFFSKKIQRSIFCRGHGTLHLAIHPSIEFLNSEWFLGSGPKGPMSCRTQGGVLRCPSVLPSFHPLWPSEP